jgi:hypothetical protein
MNKMSTKLSFVTVYPNYSVISITFLKIESISVSLYIAGCLSRRIVMYTFLQFIITFQIGALNQNLIVQ